MVSICDGTLMRSIQYHNKPRQFSHQNGCNVTKTANNCLDSNELIARVLLQLYLNLASSKWTSLCYTVISTFKASPLVGIPSPLPLSPKIYKSIPKPFADLGCGKDWKRKETFRCKALLLEVSNACTSRFIGVAYDRHHIRCQHLKHRNTHFTDLCLIITSIFPLAHKSL